MFIASFMAVCAVATLLAIQNRSPTRLEKSVESGNDTPEEFKKFQRSFLVVALLAWFSDWLQGAYIYDLYSSYGFKQAQIAQLFVAGFLSSMMVGSYVGAMADKYGRKKMCTVFAITYILSCCTKPFNSFRILMFGRILGGIATSLLFTVFEAWMVCEHRTKGFNPSLLSSTFSRLTTGNGLVAVAAGLVANGSTALFKTPLAPFIVSCVPLFLVSMLSLRWNENYGDQSVSVAGSLKRAWVYLYTDSRIVTIGLAQALFEAGMYVFVFIWTPALQETEPYGITSVHAHLGVIFAAFMMCTIVGSNILELLMGKNGSGVSMYDMALISHMLATIGLTAASIMKNTMGMYASFLVFEVAVGMFYPAYSMIKSKHIQEEVRSTIMNYFRIPLNALVAIALLRISEFSSSAALCMASALQLLALCIYIQSRKMLMKTNEKEMEALKAVHHRSVEIATMGEKNDV